MCPFDFKLKNQTEMNQKMNQNQTNLIFKTTTSNYYVLYELMMSNDIWYKYLMYGNFMC